MLDAKTIRQVTGFVSDKPRTIQEIAMLLGRNWRTADRYVERIIEETGALATRTFREGSRGALKIVYFVNNDRIANTEFQERLLQRILAGRTKEDFSPFDIYQYAEHGDAFLETIPQENVTAQDLATLLRGAQQTVLLFSGNLSWANLRQGKTLILDVLEEIARRGVTIKIVTRVDIASIVNIRKVLGLNERLGREAVEIRHAEQPLRCIMIDQKTARLKETKSPDRYEPGELPEKTFIYYDIHDEEWVAWLQKVFWKMFSSGIPARRRIALIEGIRRIRPQR